MQTHQAAQLQAQVRHRQQELLKIVLKTPHILKLYNLYFTLIPTYAIK